MGRQIKRIFSTVFALVVAMTTVHGHGGMVEPPMRSIMWRYGFDAPVNYDWNALYCGGRQNFIEHKGKCGFCGDAVQGPYENDKGGVYDTGVIVRHYPAGLGEIEVKVELTAHHKGFFEFKLCANNEGPITQECLNRYPLPIREGFAQGTPLRYAPPVTPKLHELHLALPPGMICDRCALQWTYTAGNSFGQGESGGGCVGCGYQETFVNCADISIGGSKDRVPVNKGQIQDGGVFEIADKPEITAVLDKAEPGASVRDILRELGVVIPGTESPPPPKVPVLRRPPVVTSQTAKVESKPKPTRTLISVVKKGARENPIKAQFALNSVSPKEENAKKIIPKPLPNPRNRAMNRRISTVPDLGQIPNDHNWDMIDSLQSDFHPRPNHDLLIDASIPAAGVHNTGVDEIIRSRQQGRADHWQARARDLLEPDVLKTSRSGRIDIPVPNGPADHSLPLVDAVYSLRDQMPGPKPQDHVPQVDIYGRVRGLTPFGDQVRHDQFQQERERSQRYMEKLEKLKQLGHGIQSSLTDYHNKQYRKSLRSGSYPPLIRDSGSYPPSRDSGSYSHLRDSGSYSPLRDSGSYSPLSDSGSYSPLSDSGSYSSSYDSGSYPPLHDGSTSHYDNYLSHQTRNRHTAEFSHEIHIPKRIVFTLPRRITVHSMSVARRLVQRYPVLRGRVYLSRRAHHKNKYARRIHRYARRHKRI